MTKMTRKIANSATVYRLCPACEFIAGTTREVREHIYKTHTVDQHRELLDDVQARGEVSR